MSYEEKEKLIKSDISSIENRVRHAFNQGYDLGYKDGIDTQSKTGHWIYDDECHEHGHCSKCGYGSIDLVDGELHNFCRRCGAKMIEPQKSEEWTNFAEDLIPIIDEAESEE